MSLECAADLRLIGVSNRFTLCLPPVTLDEGDIILTGTPEGVGAVEPGQVITAGITGIAEMRFPVLQGI